MKPDGSLDYDEKALEKAFLDRYCNTMPRTMLRYAIERLPQADRRAYLTGVGQVTVPETGGACFDMIERDMLKGPWVMGENYTVCDAYLFTVARWLEGDGVDPERIPKVMDHRQRVSEREAVKRALADEQ